MPSAKRKFGDWGERAAEFFLKEKGYSIIARNFTTRYGEIDLICRRGDRFIFVEVKTRSGLKFGTPEEAVTRTKQAHLIAAAEIFFSQNNIRSPNWQIDVIGILGAPGDKNIKIRHIENAVSYA